MITKDPTQNVGYDFDLNIRFNINLLSPKDLKLMLMRALNVYDKEFGYDPCEDSTRVITIKVKDQYNSRIVHSADFCFVHDLPDGRVQIIKNNKSSNYYYWETLAQYPKALIERADALKNRGLWKQVKNLYLKKKK